MTLLPVFSPITEHTLPKLPHSKIWIKRDDLIDPIISGNKWRKLKYTLQKAAEQKKRHLVSFGGAFSNHLLALASAGAKFGFQTTAFVRGENVQNPVLQFCRLFGMQIIFVDRKSYLDKKALFDTYFGADKHSFFIDEGGAGALAIKGCEEILEEIPPTFDHIFCASGTGTTAKGLYQGIQNRQLKTHLHIVPVLKNIAEIQTLFKDHKPDTFTIYEQYYCGGYAKTPPNLLAFIQEFVAHTGVMIDPIYTAKVFLAVQDLILREQINSTEKILVLHTGGLMGILGKLDLLQPNNGCQN